MKRIILLVVSLCFASFLFAQKTTEIKTNQLPKAVTKYVTDNMPGSTISKAVKIEDGKTVQYGTVVDSKGRKHILIFDKDGKFVKKADKLTEDQKQQAAPKK
jgi:hypothetical protein